MLNKIKNITNSEDKKILISNFFSLSFLQGANYILPLITLPYLLRVLGVEYFGLLAFATATIMYFQIITDYGFQLTATRDISIHRDNKVKVIEIFSSVMIIKVILMFTSLLLLVILVFSIEKFRKDALIYFLTFGTVIGQVLFPVWFFQGMEKMKYITYLNIIPKILFTIAIFVFVKEQSDYFFVPFFSSLGYIIAGFMSLILIKKEFGVGFKLQKKENIKYHLIEGWNVFISGFFTITYTISVPFLLGLLTNTSTLGTYSVAEKATNAIIKLFTPLNQAVFPYINKLISISKSRAKSFLLKLTIASSILAIIISINTYFFADEIIRLISGKYLKDSIIILKILSPLPIIIVLAKIFSFNYIVSFNLSKYLTKIYLTTALFSLPVMLTLMIKYEEFGAALSVIIIELFATIYMWNIIKSKIKF